MREAMQKALNGRMVELNWSGADEVRVTEAGGGRYAGRCAEIGEPDRWFPLKAVPGRAYTAEVRGKAMRGGKKIKAVIPGGSSMPVLTGEVMMVSRNPVALPGRN